MSATVPGASPPVCSVLLLSMFCAFMPNEQAHSTRDATVEATAEHSKPIILNPKTSTQ